MTTIKIIQPIAAPVPVVWDCLTDPSAVRDWFGPHMALDARPGGGFREVWQDGARTVVTSGEVLAFAPQRRLVLSWADADWPTRTTVTLTLTPEGAGTRLVLDHAGWQALGPKARDLAAAHRAGWQAHLDALKAHAERMAHNSA